MKKFTVLFAIFVLVLTAGARIALAKPNHEKSTEEIIEESKRIVEKVKKTKFDKDIECEGITQEGFKRLTGGDQSESDSGEDGFEFFNLLGRFFGGEKEIMKANAAQDHIGEIARGVYLPSEKKFYYLKTASPEEIAETAVHELTHAMQDQQLDLNKFLNECGTNFDLYTARRALLEGEATCVGLDYTFGGLGTRIEQFPVDLGMLMSMSQPFHSQGGVFKEWFAFQYSCGSSFLQAYVKEEGWKRVPLLYKNPPLSTEQMMHREKYKNGTKDYPVSVQLRVGDSLLGEGWEGRMLVTLGEYMLGSLLESSLSDPYARKACVGWDGDEWAFFVNKETQQVAAVALTTWDSDTDAREFAALYSRHIIQTRGAEHDFTTVRRTMRDIDIMVWRKGETAYVLARRGKEVLVLDGVPFADISEIVRKVFRKAKRVYHPDDRYCGRRDRETTVVAEMAYSYELDVIVKVRTDRFGGLDVIAGGDAQGGNIKSGLGHFVLTVEKGEWEVRRDKRAPNCLALMSNKIRLMVGFVEMPLEGFPGVNAVMQAQMAENMEFFDSVRVLKKGKMKIDGHDAYYIKIRATKDDETVILCQMVVPHEKFVLLIDYITNPDDQEKAEEAFKRLLATLKFAK